MMHLIEGDDEYRIALKRDELKADFLRAQEAAIEHYDGKDNDFNLSSLFQSVSTLSFFVPRKIIIVDDAGELINRDKNFLSQKSGMRIFEDIINSGDDVLLIFTTFEKQIAKNSRIYKIIEERGKIWELRKFWHDPNEGATGEFRRWVESEIKGRKLDLTPAQVNFLVTRAGSDLRQITNELDKIMLYLDGKSASTLSEDALGKLVPPSRELIIFNLIDAIAQKNSKRALAYLENLITSGEGESVIVMMIHRQMRQIYQWQILESEGKSQFERSKELGLSNYTTRKIASQAPNFPLKTLPTILSAISMADEEIKNSLLPGNIILEKLVIRLAG
jgi:DNA polymerase-3 subunit delta